MAPMGNLKKNFKPS